jgi:chemotaxis protein methyltransferase WspC
MNRLEQKLRQEIGLDPAAIGRAVFERTVRRRLTTLGLAREIKPSERTGASVSAISRAEDGLSEYLQLLESSATEREELIEALVVKETWFFRDREPFHAFAQLAREWLVQHPGETLRALSVPCATGEEPYSLAMALLDAHVPPERFTIDAADLSVRALAQARQAVYGKNSFRGADLGFRDRHFTPVPCLPDRPAGGYALNPQVRERVRFHAANLLGADFMRGAKPWDFVFCRHLLIYFDRATQARALAKLADLLPPRGWLFVGPAEMPLATAHGFVSAKLPMAFACQKAEAPLRPSPPTDVPPSRCDPPGEGGVGGEGESRPAATGSPDAGQRLPVSTLKTNRVESTISHLLAPAEGLASPSAAHAVPELASDLVVARELADAGRHEDAAALCEAHLRQQGPSAEAYYLLGLIGEARGETQAINYYRKALYLAPNHYEALRQISLLLEKNGDRNGARNFRHRAERVQPGKASPSPPSLPPSSSGFSPLGEGGGGGRGPHQL